MNSEVLAALGTATILADKLERASTRANFLRDELTRALQIPDEAARADRAAPLLDQLHALGTAAEDL